MMLGLKISASGNTYLIRRKKVCKNEEFFPSDEFLCRMFFLPAIIFTEAKPKLIKLKVI